MNAAESAAFRARTALAIQPTGQVLEGTTVPVMIIALGLGGATDTFPDQFLRHVSNDPSSDLFSSHQTEPVGLYEFSPDKTGLQAAFARVASFVLRLSA